MGLLVVFKQLLQSLHVELVIMTHLVFSRLEGLGHRDGAAHCREGGCGRQGSLAANEMDSSSPPQGSPLTHSNDGLGKWYQTPGVGREATIAPEDGGGKSRESLEGNLALMLPGVLVKRLDSVDIILPKGIHRHKGGPGRVARGKKGLLQLVCVSPRA